MDGISGRAPIPMDANALSAKADLSTDESVKEDMKLNRSRRAAAMSSQVSNAQKQIEQNKIAADERLQGNLDKANGGMIGGLLGCLALAICIGLCFVFPALAVGLLAVGAGALAAGSSIGGAIGGKAAAGNEAAADAAKEKADLAELNAKVFEKEGEDRRDALKQSEQVQQQVWQDARKRRDERQKASFAA